MPVIRVFASRLVSMGSLTSHQKRPYSFSNPPYQYSPEPYRYAPDYRSLKKPRFSLNQQSPEKSTLSSNSTVSRLSRYPEIKPPLPREVHAPCKSQKFGFLASRFERGIRLNSSGYIGKEDSTPASFNKMGNLLSRYDSAKRTAMEAIGYLKKDKEVIAVDGDEGTEAVSDDSGIEEMDIMGNAQELDVKIVGEKSLQPSSSSGVTESNNGSTRVENALSLSNEGMVGMGLEPYKKLLKDVESRRDPKLKDLGFQIEYNLKRWDAQRSLRSLRTPEEKPEEKVPQEPFIPLTDEELTEVQQAFSVNRRKVLVTHENSNIDITGQIMQCLRPGAWLNDEVINLYLELLKEREKREPKKFLKCHFFNTFFYKKLIGDGSGYNYKAVKRWTTQRKLGYLLDDCDRIFVPIHQEIHWCLAIISKKDQKLQYLDSLKGRDGKVLNALARYFAEEVKDKGGKNIDLSSWEREYVEDLPEQMNGFDCGMFMLKYVDFYSRGLGLCFSQDHMPYFRLRTAKEVLRLRAD